MSSLSPLAHNPAFSNLANLIIAANVPHLPMTPVVPAINQSLNGNVPLPMELDRASQSIGMPTVYLKPTHLNYLRDFRTQQCPLFANHKCTQHKPFTCFHWHFPNQRRRRPLRQADGTFSYSPDVYCDKYDETRGECPNGDACPYLHRNAGDTERRYHLRYFKTGTCIHDTDPRGHCSRNGAHCAFAHGANDLRVPVYDIREVQEASDCPINLPASLEKERVLSEDPKWNDMTYVLANYKTEQCKKPPRMCRQGYACPFFHNSKDRRRGPQMRKYRSTPCPAVKSADEWLDSSLCDSGDDCQYCHTRTEQQFHPEIYKSTKCNDVMQQNYCPRGPFCAFAHDEAEMNFGRSFMQDLEFHSLVQASVQQRQHQGQLAPLALTRLISPSVWEPPAAASPPAIHTAAAKGRSPSGTSLASLESGLGSMYRGDSPINAGKLLLSNQMRAAAAAAAAASQYPPSVSPNSAMLPELDDLDLSLVENSSSVGSDSLSPLSVVTSTNPIGIPGAASPVGVGTGAAGYAASYQTVGHSGEQIGGGSLPFHTGSMSDPHASTSRRHRGASGSDRSPASSTYAQSPILMSNSPFSNPGMDLERLQYQQEIERTRQEAARLREAALAAQRERDQAQYQLAAVRDRLRDISAIAASSPQDLGRCSAEELNELKARLHQQLQCVQMLTSHQQQQQQQQGQEEAEDVVNLNSSSSSLGFGAVISASADEAAA